MLGTRLGLSEGLDQQVQGTNDDAQISKLSCSRAGYFNDEFVQYFVRKPTRRSPLINRGYYSRYAGLRQLLLQFLTATKDSDPPAQVLVLGAGYDTTWFQLTQAGKRPVRYLEVDFKQVTQRKVGIIKQLPLLSNIILSHAVKSDQAVGVPNSTSSSHIMENNTTAAAPTATSTTTLLPPDATPAMPPPPSRTAPTTAASLHLPHSPPPHCSGGLTRPLHVLPTADPAAAQGDGQTAGVGAGAGVPGLHVCAKAGELVTEHYTILPVDLRDLTALDQAVKTAGLDTSAPTYILSECVMVYMEPAASSTLINWAATRFSNAMCVIYEQIKPDDAFGRQMMGNLESRGCPLRGLPATPSLEAHCRRLVDCGLSRACAWDMDHVYKCHLDPADKARVEALEVFDEYEEWHLIQEHYSISMGLTDQAAAGLLAGVGFGPEGRVTATRQPAELQ